MCTALIVVEPGVSAGSVQAAAVRPLRVRAALTAVRSSVMCVAFMTVVPATSGSSVKVVVAGAKVAVTAVAPISVTTHVPVPVQLPPLQPVKVDPAAGAAVRVTMVPDVNETEQVVPQLMPAGELVTVPLPVPLLFTLSAKDACMKVAVTEAAAFKVTTQVPVPVQPPPLQPVKVDPAAGAALSVMTVPDVNEVEQVAPQLIPAGVLVTVPTPAPALLTVSAKDDCMKVAVTL